MHFESFEAALQARHAVWDKIRAAPTRDEKENLFAERNALYAEIECQFPGWKDRVKQERQAAYAKVLSAQTEAEGKVARKEYLTRWGWGEGSR